MPYSDNLYSLDDDDDEYSDVEPAVDHQQLLETVSEAGDDDAELLSPADGNFPATSSTAEAGSIGGGSGPVSSNVPRVPNVLVRDPSLEQGTTAESKAREARQEALTNQSRAEDDDNDDDDVDSSAVVHTAPSTSSSAINRAQYTPSTSSRATHHYQPSTASYYTSAGSTTSSHNTSSAPPRRSIYTARSPFLPREAPPAYTPSPTTPSTSTGSTSPPVSPTAPLQGHSDFSRNYRTFSQSTGMGRTEESRGLLASDPESMGGRPDDEFGGLTPAWRDRFSRRLPYLNWRNCRIVGVILALMLVTVGFLVSVIKSVEDEVSDVCHVLITRPHHAKHHAPVS